jgi:hypothetical protein
MPELSPAQRAAGAASYATVTHPDGMPCTCVGAIARLAHRHLPYPNQGRYGPTPKRRVRFNRKPNTVVTAEGDGWVATCTGCGWTLWTPSEHETRKKARAHEKCPAPPGKKRR